MEVSERVTWELCPNCDRLAAVGWLDEEAIEFDCPGGCLVSVEQVRELVPGPRAAD